LEAERQERERRQAEGEQHETERRRQEERAQLQAEQKERLEAQRCEAETRERLEAASRVPRENEPQALEHIGANPSAPRPDRTPSEGGIANLKRLWRLLVVIGIGVAFFLLGFNLFRTIRYQPISNGGSLSPTPAPLAAAANSRSPQPLVGQASPSPNPSAAERLAGAAAAGPPIQTAAPSGSPALPIRRGSALVGESSALVTQPSVSLLATPTPAPPNSARPTPSVSQ
jgi:hypothetical protein